MRGFNAIPSDGSLEALKWAALALMVVDHTGNYLLDGPTDHLRLAGRASMPLFAFVLGCNLARPGMLAQGGYQRLAKRLFLCASFASIPFIAVNELEGWLPLNVMATLLVAVGVAWLLDKGGRFRFAALVLFAVGGALGEYGWPVIAACLFARDFCRQPSAVRAAGFVASVAALYFMNGSHGALGALPLIALAWLWPANLPRQPYFFYAFYPAHFFAIWAYLAWLK